MKTYNTEDIIGVDNFCTLANIDGFGGQVKIIFHSTGVTIEAGCFIGTADEFIAKAAAEGKKRYVRVIKAVIESW